MNFKFKSGTRKLMVERTSNRGVMRERFHLLPTVRINNWMPGYPFYHVTFIWLRMGCDVWWTTSP